MARFEVTYRATGPWQDGSRVEALVTLPVKVPGSTPPADRCQAAVEAAYPAWVKVLAALKGLAAGKRVRVVAEVREL